MATRESVRVRGRAAAPTVPHGGERAGRCDALARVHCTRPSSNVAGRLRPPFDSNATCEAHPTPAPASAPLPSYVPPRLTASAGGSRLGAWEGRAARGGRARSARAAHQFPRAWPQLVAVARPRCTCAVYRHPPVVKVGLRAPPLQGESRRAGDKVDWRRAGAHLCADICQWDQRAAPSHSAASRPVPFGRTHGPFWSQIPFGRTLLVANP